MVLPNNGRIVIIDDQLNEAAPLINILSKKRIPFNYYSGQRITDFPDSPNENKIRMLFLDLNIVESQKDIKTVISTLDPIIKAIVPDNPNPYLLIIWSKKNDEFGAALEKHISDTIPEKTPAKIVFLHKQKYFNYEDGEWIPEDDCIDKIQEDLNKELEGISLLRNLITWENIVHQTSADTINEFSSFYIIDNDWDKKSKAIIFHLAKSIVGDDSIGNLNDTEKLAKAFININSFLSDKLETEINSLKLGEAFGITDESYNRNQNTNGLTSKIKSLINEKLHISNKDFTINDFEQGNVYVLENHDNFIEKILWDKMFNPPNNNKLNEIRDNSLLIQLDVTPVCDYSQDKDYVRLIYGIVSKEDYKKHFRSQFYCCTPVINILNEEKILLFDFRFITTVSKEELKQRNIIPSFKLRREICTDIQSQLSNQVNRPGISNV